MILYCFRLILITAGNTEQKYLQQNRKHHYIIANNNFCRQI